MPGKTYPDWFENTCCSLCEHFKKQTLTCKHNTKVNPHGCNMSNHHKMFKSIKMESTLPRSEPKKLKPTCSHPNLQQHTLQAGKRSFSERTNKRGKELTIKEREYIDWRGSIINGHYLRCIKYWCPTCGAFIIPPSDAKD